MLVESEPGLLSELGSEAPCGIPRVEHPDAGIDEQHAIALAQGEAVSDDGRVPRNHECAAVDVGDLAHVQLLPDVAVRTRIPGAS